MQNKASTARVVVVLGTGGTIAGTAADPSDHLGYTAAQIGVAQLVAAVPPLADRLTSGLTSAPLECEQVAQVDSKDMDHAIWFVLAQRIVWHLARDDVAGIVVTHGTDTLEETAYFLQRVLAPKKPVVLTAAMRPATSFEADGPQNLLDAVCVARSPAAHGVAVVLAGRVHAAHDVRKLHSQRVDAFSSGDAGPLARIEQGEIQMLREPWPQDAPFGLEHLPSDPAQWPRVHLVTSHAGVCASVVSALCAAGADGLVVAATGNGTVHHALESALHQAQARGVAVWRSSRCAAGGIVGGDEKSLPSAGDLTPVKARIELMLRLMR